MSTPTTSYLTLDTCHRRVRDAVADPQRMHQLVMDGYRNATGDSATARADHNILFAIDQTGTNGQVRLVCQADTRPDWAPLNECTVTTPVTTDQAPAWTAGDTVAFRVDLNPMASTVAPRNPLSPDAPRARGIRRPIRDRQEQLDWAHRKLTTAGLETTGMTIAAERKVTSPSKKGMRLNITTFTGTATVTDPDLLDTALRTGLGRGKAYGCGLLLLR